jgi:hypothetical protein
MSAFRVSLPFVSARAIADISALEMFQRPITVSAFAGDA